MTGDVVEEILARVFSRADYAPFKGDVLRAELVHEGLSYRDAKEILGKIQRGEFPEYGFAKKGAQRIAYFEKKHVDRLDRGYRPQASERSLPRLNSKTAVFVSFHVVYRRS